MEAERQKDSLFGFETFRQTILRLDILYIKITINSLIISKG